MHPIRAWGHPPPTRRAQMKSRDLDDVNVVIPNLHWRYSGVTATNRAVAPRLRAHVRAAWLGRDAPAGIATLTFGDLLRLRVRNARTRIWHARRNNEMLVGLALKRPSISS